MSRDRPTNGVVEARSLALFGKRDASGDYEWLRGRDTIPPSLYGTSEQTARISNETGVVLALVMDIEGRTFLVRTYRQGIDGACSRWSAGSHQSPSDVPRRPARLHVLDRAQDRGVGQEPEKSLLSRAAKENRCRLFDRVQPFPRGGVVEVLGESQGQPEIAIAEVHDAGLLPLRGAHLLPAQGSSPRPAGLHGRTRQAADRGACGQRLVCHALGPIHASGDR